MIVSSVVSAQTVDSVVPAIHPELKKHTDHLVKKVYKVTGVYSSVSWNAGDILRLKHILDYFEPTGVSPISLTINQ